MFHLLLFFMNNFLGNTSPLDMFSMWALCALQIVTLASTSTQTQERLCQRGRKEEFNDEEDISGIKEPWQQQRALSGVPNVSRFVFVLLSIHVFSTSWQVLLWKFIYFLSYKYRSTQRVSTAWERSDFNTLWKDPENHWQNGHLALFWCLLFGGERMSDKPTDTLW